MYVRYEKYLKLIEQYYRGGKLLDVGCGTGYFLKYVKDRNNNWKVFGIEPSSLLRSVAQKNTKITIKTGTLRRIPYGDNYFNVITCFDVLEHSKDLNENLYEIRRVLKPGGLLLVQAPNYESFMANITGDKWDWWCIPDHILHFSYTFLCKILISQDFTILAKYTYENKEDFLSNIKAKFSGTPLTKTLYYLLIPVFIFIEKAVPIINRGGLSVVLVRK
ncbi:MAG: class I SAM-dependent methyltransferase [Patescibacteria group bacterium]